MRDNDLYIWIHQQLNTNGEVNLRTIEGAFPESEDSRRFAKEYLDRLSREKILHKQSDSYVVVDRDAERAQYYKILEPSNPSTTPTSDAVHQPVVSIPSQLQGDWDKFTDRQGIDPGISLKDALKHVVNSATNTLRLVVPFFEVDGLDLIDDEFQGLAEAGISVEVLTREALIDDGTYSNNRNRKAISELIDRYESYATAKSSIQVYDYHKTIGHHNSKLDRSIHAKMAIADDHVAYVGSGEVRTSSMHLNGEAGYLTRDHSEIETWIGFFKFFKEKSETVTRAQLN